MTIAPQENSQTLDLFKAGQLDGAWLPEPWASRLVVDAGAHVLLDEKDLWPDGDFVTTHLIVSTDYLSKYPGTVKKLLEAEYATSEWIAANPDEAKTLSNTVIEKLSGKPLSAEVLDRAWEQPADHARPDRVQPADVRRPRAWRRARPRRPTCTASTT